ncbi:MAG TPA: hypothetical protein VJN63_11885, partial [Thermoplasmata archaeon]|nr:hypothetical protein [Thermoplasmata archaeon]
WPDLTGKEWQGLARKGYDALPGTVRAYLEMISETLHAPLRLVSVGRSRDATIDLQSVDA